MSSPAFNPNADYTPAPAVSSAPSAPMFDPDAAYEPAQRPSYAEQVANRPGIQPPANPMQVAGYQATAAEQTPEGHAAAVAQREQEQPVVTGIGKGAGDILGAIAAIPSGIWHQLPPVQLHDSVKRALPVIDTYEKSRAGGLGVMDSLNVANEQAKKQDALGQAVKQRFNEWQKNPTAETIRALTDVAGSAALVYAGGAPAAEGEATAGAGEAESAAAAERPGIVQQVLRGEKVAQPGAQAAVRQAAQASTEAAGTADESTAANLAEQPILKGNQTLLDEPLAKLADKEKALYKRVDDAVGFDLKAEKQQLANDTYKLSQLGGTDADIAQRGNLTEVINDSQDRIAAAEAKLRQAGIDPKAADVAHQGRMAGEQFENALVKATNSDGSIDVDKLLNASKNLRFNPKYGDRLGQFFGKENADNLMASLQQAQRNGVAAIRTQRIAKWLAARGASSGFPARRAT